MSKTLSIRMKDEEEEENDIIREITEGMKDNKIMEELE